MPHRPIRIAAQLHPQHGPFAGLRSAAVQADDLGYDIIYTWDHFYPLYGSADGAHFESLTTLTSFAEATKRAEIGPLVLCNTYRNPHLVADMARTIDHISGGRFILGIGAGWFQRDYDEYGYEFGTAASRIRALGRALPEMVGRLARLSPPPVRKMPILIAGTGETLTLPLVARYADSWHAAFPAKPKDLEKPVAALRKWCDEIGRDPHEIEWGLGLQPNALSGTLRDEYVEMGFTQFTLGFNGPQWNVASGAEWLAWRDEVNSR
jgi:probable F420-dependent oxidoreductase